MNVGSGSMFKIQYSLFRILTLYMQFPVPQFTDVEDKIIANLTFRQFGIILATGGIIFFSYSLSKDIIVTSITAFVVGIPGLILAFAQFNGRPMYRSIILLFNYLASNKLLVFRKQSIDAGALAVATVNVGPEQVQQKRPLDEDPRTRLKKIQYQLEQRASEEAALLANSKPQTTNDKQVQNAKK